MGWIETSLFSSISDIQSEEKDKNEKQLKCR
jgi:hypothetical protein